MAVSLRATVKYAKNQWDSHISHLPFSQFYLAGDT